ncbi:MAG: SDR family NAD(P)-dependent oxidoreductase [Gammaproteobacteria bacterium]|nr:MAG: SDR family NAD(P)-dependent oxidoreductase [Gammaproteobacteria bacterium]
MNSKYADSCPWQVAWITGAGRGIGAALAKKLCQLGCTVYGSSRSLDELVQLQRTLSDTPGRFIPAPLDIRRPGQISALFERWDREGVKPQLFVLNAGIHDPDGAEGFSAQRCRRLLDVNLQGTINCLDFALRHSRHQRAGHIAVMSSVAGYRGLPTAAAYCASKAALISLCESLYMDIQGTGIRLQVINPGFVRTPLTDKNDFHMPALMEPEDAAEAIYRGLCSQRFEITFPARFVYWLKLLRILPHRLYLPLMRWVAYRSS